MFKNVWASNKISVYSIRTHPISMLGTTMQNFHTKICYLEKSMWNEKNNYSHELKQVYLIAVEFHWLAAQIHRYSHQHCLLCWYHKFSIWVRVCAPHQHRMLSCSNSRPSHWNPTLQMTSSYVVVPDERPHPESSFHFEQWPKHIRDTHSSERKIHSHWQWCAYIWNS